MHLKKVTLNNFRCFEHLALDLHPRLTVLVAENGGGKTAILDGIAFGLAPVLSNLSSANQRLSVPVKKDTDLRLVPRVSRGDKTSWMACDFAQVEVETTSGLKWDRIQTSKDKKHSGSKIGQGALAAYLSRIYDGLQSDSQELLPVIAYYGARRGWIAVPGRLHESKVNYSYPASALVGALDSLTDFKEMLKWFDREESSELRANKGRSGEEWDESLALCAVRGAINDILCNAYHNPQFTSKHQFVVESKLTPGMLLRVEQLSQGYQSMLALAMDFARRLALANDHLTTDNILPIIEASRDWVHLGAVENSEAWTSPPLFAPAIMLVDEIDLHLHPSWQQRVLGDLMRAFPCTQFIVTTHSPQVLSTVPAECIRLLQSEGDEETKQRIVVEYVTRQTQGIGSADILASVMGTDPVPPIDKAAWLSQYRALIQMGRQASPEGAELRQKLVAHFGAEHPEMLECERLIRLETFKRKLPPLTDNHASGRKE